MLHIPIVHAHDVSKQIPREKNFPSGWKCYKTIGSYVSCAFIEIWSTWEVWRALKKLELLSATPRATLTHLSCSPNFLRASYLDERTLTYEPIVNYNPNLHWTPRFARASWGTSRMFPRSRWFVLDHVKFSLHFLLQWIFLKLYPWTRLSDFFSSLGNANLLSTIMFAQNSTKHQRQCTLRHQYRHWEW